MVVRNAYQGHICQKWHISCVSDSNLSALNVNSFNPYKKILILSSFVDEAAEAQRLISCQGHTVDKKLY